MRPSGRITPNLASGRALALIVVLLAMLAGNLAASFPAAHDDHAPALVLADAVEGASDARDDGRLSAGVNCNTGLGCMAVLLVPVATPLAPASGDEVAFGERQFAHASPIFGLFRPPRRV